MATWLDVLTRRSRVANKDKNKSILKHILTGSFYRISAMRGSDTLSTIKNQIQTMRALAADSQIATALSYYATDATTVNSAGQIIWATSIDPKFQDAADIVNAKLKEWNINTYARDHILEIATVGNLYLPTTELYRQEGSLGKEKVSLDGNTIRNDKYEVVASTKIEPESCVHLWYQGESEGYGIQREDGSIVRYSENAIIHFALGGLLGDYTLPGRNSDGQDIDFDIQFGRTSCRSYWRRLYL